MKNENKDLIQKSLWCRFFQRVMTALVYVALRPKIEWKDENLKKQVGKKPYIFVCNHTHHFDGVFAGAILNKFQPYVLVRNDWYEKGKLGTMIKWCRSIPINPEEFDISWYNSCEDVLKSGKSVLIFPEDGIAREGKMLDFKPGAGMISAKNDVDIVPIAIYGEYKLFFGKKQKIVIGKRIESHCPETERHSKYAKKLMAQAENDVKSMYGELQKRYGNLGVYYKEEF